MAATGILVFWYTGVLVYWYYSTQGVIISTLLILGITVFVYKPGY